MTEDRSQPNPDFRPATQDEQKLILDDISGTLSEKVKARIGDFASQPPKVHNPIHYATADQQKPLLKMLRRMMQRRDVKTKRFTKPPRRSKRSKENLY